MNQRTQRGSRGGSQRAAVARSGRADIKKKRGGDPGIPIVQLVAAIMVTMLLAILYSGAGHRYTTFAKIAFTLFIIVLAAIMAWSVRFLERREGTRRRHAPRVRRLATAWMITCMVVAHLVWILPSTPLVPRTPMTAALAAAVTVLPVFVLGFEDLRDVLAGK